MTKRRAFKRWIAGLSALVMLLTIGLALPVGAQAEKNTVRVLLTRLNLTDRLEIALDGSYTLDGMSFQRGSRLVLSCATGRIMVYYEGMALDSGKELVLTRHQAAEGLENGLRLNGDYALYRGDLHVKTDGKMLTAVLHIPIEEYLLGVVPYEMSDSFPLEALKAQAVAARTYALYKMRGASGAYDLVDTSALSAPCRRRRAWPAIIMVRWQFAITRPAMAARWSWCAMCGARARVITSPCTMIPTMWKIPKAWSNLPLLPKQPRMGSSIISS